MQIHELHRRTKLHKKKTVGRGGKRGTTSGKGTKGQKARSGRKLRPELRDIIKKLPKRRGRGKNSFLSIVTKADVVNLGAIDKAFKAGEIVSPTTLAAKKLVRGVGRGRTFKVLATGALTKALVFENCLVSESAANKIKAVGGTVTMIASVAVVA